MLGSLTTDKGLKDPSGMFPPLSTIISIYAGFPIVEVFGAR
jgi:hypothetical protein